MRKIAVVIATTLGRPKLLERSLASVRRQTRVADYVVLACDASAHDIAAFRANYSKTENAGMLHIVVNQRRRGLSANLNTAFDHMTQLCPATTIVSLLDDDDFWSDTYLACVENQFDAGAQFVAAPYTYLGEDDALDTPRRPPASIDLDMFLVGNPGISNSTMSIEFSVLSAIGGWNAALQSCTDRDACLRLCEASAIYAVADGAIAHIDRRHGGGRLTDKGGEAKFNGLEVFYRQWRHAMSRTVYDASRRRAFKLFDFDPGVAVLEQPDCHSDPGSNHLVIATISIDPKLLHRLLWSLERFASPDFQVTVLVLRNNPNAMWEHPETEHLELRYYSPPKVTDILKIAEARNIIQEKTKSYLQTRQKPAPVWFLDEDFTVDDTAISKIKQVMSRIEPDMDAVLGQYEGDSPNAALSGLLYELLDLKANIQWLKQLPADKQLPDRSAENEVWMAAHPDTYHYALSLDSKPRAHHVAWLEPEHSTETAQEAYGRLLNILSHLTTGNSIFRQLRPLGDMQKLELKGPSLHRGGTILILNPAMLDVPFPVINGPNGPLRRSDMMWALLAKEDYGFTIHKSNISTQHRRKEGTISELSVEKTLDELIGSCVFNSLKRSLEEQQEHRFAEFLKERADRTLVMLARYFSDIDAALDALDGLGISKVAQLTARLRSLLTDTFKQELLNEVSKLTQPDMALHLKSQFDQNRQIARSTMNTCQLIRDKSKMTVSTHFDDRIQLLSLGDLTLGKRPLIRIHSSCQFSEVFGAKDCDCASQLDAALAQIEDYGCGAVLYIQQEGRGHGLQNKINIVRNMQQTDLTTYEACENLGLAHDVRCYQQAKTLLAGLGVRRFYLLTNNPAKADDFQQPAFDVIPKALRGTMSIQNRAYLASKYRFRHRDLFVSAELLNDKFHDDTDPVCVDSTNGPWGELSNFSRYPVFEDSVIWPTSEHLYQAQKFASATLREEIRCAPTPHHAKEIAHHHTTDILRDWNDAKLTVMYSTVKRKLNQNPDVKEVLLTTGRREIVEISKDDMFWGRAATGAGHNYFGKVLMLIRADMMPEV